LLHWRPIAERRNSALPDGRGSDQTQGEACVSDQPAIALVEFSSIAVGTRALDALMKKAPVALIRAGSVQPGKFAVLFGGQVAAVDESYVEACRMGAEALVDRVLLPDVDASVREAILGRRGDWSHDTLGVIETPTMAAVVEAADAAVKGARVYVVEIRLGDGLGGKGLAHFSGPQEEVEAAIQISTARIAHRNQPVRTTIIPRADETMLSTRAQSTRFGEGW
jgi:microcompartment protein CcmL/EutN